jgi:D-glycero-D-manno-heptose 1,7-bisphosphate phosphatase
MTHGRAVLLDRDGTVNRDSPTYIKSWEEFEFLPGALEAIRRLTTLGLPLVVVTNQAAIGRRLVSAEVVASINARMAGEIERHGGRVQRIYVCPHVADDQCLCRKPRPGLLLVAKEELGLDLARCYLIGDRPSDIQAGQAVGSTTVWLSAEAWIKETGPAPNHVAATLSDAIEWIATRELQQTGRKAAEPVRAARESRVSHSPVGSRVRPGGVS